MRVRALHWETFIENRIKKIKKTLVVSRWIDRFACSANGMTEAGRLQTCKINFLNVPRRPRRRRRKCFVYLETNLNAFFPRSLRSRFPYGSRASTVVCYARVMPSSRPIRTDGSRRSHLGRIRRLMIQMIKTAVRKSRTAWDVPRDVST